MKRTFEIEWDSADDVHLMLSQLRSRMKFLHSYGRRAFKCDNSSIFEVLTKVWNTDISAIYNDRCLSSERKFYVYAHLDPSAIVNVNANAHKAFAGILGMRYSPFYIGKGEGDRYTDINRSETHRKIVQRINSEKLNVETFKIETNLTEAEALAKEAKLIDIFGLVVYGGLLTNLDEGYKQQERRALYGVNTFLLRYIEKNDKKITRYRNKVIMRNAVAA